jgi:glycosyltransferase involved in cell wall biosynthesis
LIPIYDHAATIGGVVESLAPHGLPLLIEDDGSGPETKRALEAVTKRHDWVEVESHAPNRGKGFTLKQGYQHAAARGFTHVIQMDADAQHAAADVPRFLAALRDDPDALVLGQPIFDASAPRLRVHARKLSVFFVALATLSWRIGDPLCGFRGVPLAPALQLVGRIRTGDHMDFEPELAVRLLWEGVRVRQLATRVRYPTDGVSHFDVIWDDLRLAWLWLRLNLGMLLRVPRLVAAAEAAQP